jgi:flagellar motor switch protein FliM
MSKLQTVTFQKFNESLANPTVVTLFKVEPLRGISVLEIHPRLGLTIVDRLLGGPGHSVNPDRDLSEIEQALVDQAVSVVLSEWCNHWSGVQELRPVLLGHETSGRFLQTATHDTVMLVLSMEARLGDCMEQMQIALPYYTLEPLIRQLNQAMDAGPKDTAKAATPPRWNAHFNNVRVPITAEWHGLELTAREILGLKPGDVLRMDAAASRQVTVRLGDLPKFVGQIGLQNDQWAVQLTDIVKP